MRIKDAVYVYGLIGGSKLALHGRCHAHGRGEYEFHFFLEGSGTFLLNQSKYAIKKDAVFMVAPAEPHSILPDEIKNPISYYAILFEPESAPDVELISLLAHDSDTSGLPPSNSSSTGGRQKMFFAEPREHFLVREIYLLHSEKRARSAECLLSSVLHRWYGESRHDETVPKNRHVEQALAIMKKSLRKKLDIDTISAKLGLSKEHFIRVFHAQTGVSPLQYFTRLKVEAAGYFLTDTNFKVHAVAEYFGFESTSYFSKVFGKTTGFSPKEYGIRFRRSHDAQ